MKSNVKAFLAGLLALSIALACACGKKEEETDAIIKTEDETNENQGW